MIPHTIRQESFDIIIYQNINTSVEKKLYNTTVKRHKLK